MDNLEQAMRESYKQVVAEREPEPVDEGIAEQGPVGVDDVPVAEELPPAQSPTRARDANGRFIEKDAAPEKVEPARETKAPATVAKDTAQPGEPQAKEPSQTAIPVPQSLSASAKAAFAKAPPDVQQEWAKREAEATKGFTEQGSKYAEKARLADEVQTAAAPYAALLASERVTPAQALNSLLGTYYQLRTGTTAQRQSILTKMAQDFGVDLTALSSGEVPYEDPAIAQINQRFQSLEQQQAQLAQARRDAETAQTVQQLDAFKAEVDDKGAPKHPYFDEAVPEMVRLVQSGMAKDIASAYDQAVWGTPHLRAKQLAEQSARADADRVAAAKAKAVQAQRAAGTRITSSGPQPEGKVTPRTQNDLEAEMKRNLQTMKNRG